MSLRDSLQSVYDQRGALTPRLVVAEWRNPDHPDHERLEWDDSVAGERYREVQAADLIRSVRVVYRKAKGKQPERDVRAWQSVRGESGHTYQPVDQVASDPFMRQLVLMDMEREWRQLKQRYGHFAEFASLITSDLQDGAA